MLDYIRIGCAVPPVKVGDVKKNAQDICQRIAQADEQGCDLVVFPELALTGYSCGDLVFQKSLQTAVKAGVAQIAGCSAGYPALTAVVGLPAMIDGQLYNCAAVFRGGRLQALVPKTFLPSYSEFSEKRWFASATELRRDAVEAWELGAEGRYSVHIGANQVLPLGEGAILGVEICEDLWAPVPPSSIMALNGAEVIVNLAASNEAVGKRKDRQDMVTHQSGAGSCIYAFCSAGSTESTQDLVFSGHSVMAQNGRIIAENQNLIDSDYLLITDADLGIIRAERARKTSFRDAAAMYADRAPENAGDYMDQPLRGDGTRYPLSKLPFIPNTQAQRTKRCMSIFQTQVAGLKQRLSTIGANAVIGVSGGLDSTLALLVAAEAMRQLGRPLTDVYGVTMPCFGTSDRTYNNSWELMRTLGVSSKEISIREAVTGHFRDIGHDIGIHNGTYENSQARERTQILMDYASVVNGIVVGTGDLSELALGWCTYNGDHMSMYGVNASIPKSLIRWIILAIAESPDFAASRAVLTDILDTPISPELLPPDAEGKISQQTEDIVGPYALHDFFLYYMFRFGFAPTKIYHMACRAFGQDFDGETVKKWLKAFYRRFFTQQFKRNCMPDGVKVGSVCLGPRGDWRMPSDASGRVWLEEIETL